LAHGTSARNRRRRCLLASAAGAFVTGHNLVVDGGTTISD
jgi:hypothetical protein